MTFGILPSNIWQHYPIVLPSIQRPTTRFSELFKLSSTIAPCCASHVCIPRILFLQALMRNFRSLTHHHLIRPCSRDGCWFRGCKFLFAHYVFRITMLPQEFDTPCNLYHSAGLFRGMCDRSNVTLEDIQTATIEADKHRVVLQR